MQLMSEDDAAYSALLAQLLSDSAPSRNARVHSWIEHQYDFVLSEHAHLPFASSRPPSPSPSSSLGAHRGASIDRPDSPLLPRTASPCPSYDALFFPANTASKDDLDEQERVRTLRFVVQEMAHWKSNVPNAHSRDKACPPPSFFSPSDVPQSLPAPPPSPASSLASSRPLRSRSSSTRISRLPSFTSTLSSDQSQPQEIPPPLPVSVIVHGEYQHDLVIRHDPYFHDRGDSFAHSLAHSHDQDMQHLSAFVDDKDSFQPSPTLSNFSCAFSRETSVTSLYPSHPASPVNGVFSPCSPENIALPASPFEEDKPFFTAVHERSPSYRSSRSHSSFAVSLPRTNVLPASPPLHAFLPPASPPADGSLRQLRAPKQATHSQSRWSVATTASLTPSIVEPKVKESADPRTPPKKKAKSLKSPKKRARFVSLISRLSPGRNGPSATTSSNQATDDVDYDSANDSDLEDRERDKPRKSLSKKSSLASLRASFSLSRASFSSQRPPMSSSIEEVPPLPMSPTLVSLSVEPMSSEVAPILPRPSLSKVPSRSNLLNSLPPIPQSASTITTFQSASQVSISDASIPSASASRISLAGHIINSSASRISLLPPPSKRTSLASAAGVEPVVSPKQVPTSQPARSKSIFRLTTKPKSIKAPISPGSKEMATSSRLPIVGGAPSSLPMTARSRIPQAPTKFNPPAKLVTVIATQSRQVPVLASVPMSPTSKLPMPPSRVPPKVPRPSAILEKTPPSVLPSSRLPMPASTKAARVGTVKGFWRRQ